MISFLAKTFIKDYQNTDDENVRHAYGNLTSLVGIVNNIVLFVFKFMVGTLAGSVSITADAVNNLSDAGSSIISLISFRLSSRPADEEHPFGHARYECIASMLVACLILLLGFELIKTSAGKILHPEEVLFSWVSVIVLVVSIGVKLWMYMYNHHYGKVLSSSIMEATAADSISDVMATGAVLLSTILSPILHFNLDGYMGVIVACLIIYAGGGIIKSALDELLGKAPSKELVQSLKDKIYEYDGVLGIHDLIIHDYGVNRLFASVHVEVDYKVDVMKSHDMVDNIERDVKKSMGIELVIHMDPIKRDDPVTNELKEFIKKALKAIHKDLTLHDFRVVSGDTHMNVIFDVVVPYHLKLENNEILQELKKQVDQKYDACYLVVTFDKDYAG